MLNIPSISRYLLPVLLTIGALTGCEPSPTAISGRVTLDGQPLDEAAIQFIPTTPGRRKTSCEVQQGTYQLPADIGLVPGTYRVDFVDLPPLHHGTARRREFPSHYSHGSRLTIVLEAHGPRTFDFELHSRLPSPAD